jgi:thiamine pyrophosphokinase
MARGLYHAVVDVVIVANAPWRWTAQTVALAARADLLVAADGGANHLARVGLRPDAVVGDLDSITDGVRRWVGEQRLIQRLDQEHTDLHKALTYCVDERAARRITVLAATSGRLDHAVENLGLLGRWAHRCAVRFLSPEQVIVPVTSLLRVAATPGADVSLMPLGRCEGVLTTGLQWPLTGEVLDLVGRTSISNRAVEAEVHVSLTSGVLLVFLPAPGADW